MTPPSLRPPSLRPETPLDEAFLVRLFASTRETELSALPEPLRAPFVKIQHLAQTRAYLAAHPGAAWSIVLLDGEPVGRMIVDRTGPGLHLVDVAILAEHRGKGLGGALLVALLDEARAAGRKVTLHVLRANPAARLYAQLGFVRTGATEMHDAMEWRPG